jgi:RimJ/RimL family protein N-acetyltransferase
MERGARSIGGLDEAAEGLNSMEEARLKIILETGRLRLRGMTGADLDFLASMLGDPVVMKHYPKPLDRAEAADWLKRTQGCYARAGHGFWIAGLRGTGEPIGQIGLLPKESNGRPEVEVAYMLHRDHWRKGYATEAAIACRDYAFNTLKVPRVVCMIREGNAESLAVAARLGMKRIGTTMHQGLPHLLFGYSR